MLRFALAALLLAVCHAEDEIIGEAVPVAGQSAVDFCAGRQGLLVCTAQCAQEFDRTLLSAECQQNEDYDDEDERTIGPDSNGGVEEATPRLKRQSGGEGAFAKLCFCFVECNPSEGICDTSTTSTPTATSTLTSTTSTSTSTPTSTSTSTSTSTTPTTSSSPSSAAATTPSTPKMTSGSTDASASSGSEGSTAFSASTDSEASTTPCVPAQQNQEQNVAVKTSGGSSQVGVEQRQSQSAACGDQQSQVQNVAVEVADPENPQEGDCRVSPWTAWLPCSQSCGGGQHSRLRTVVEGAAEEGRRCPPLVQTEPCNVESCAEDCLVSEWSVVVPCSKTCGGGKKTRVRTVVRAPEDDGSNCPALIKLTPCNENPCPVKDCTVSGWKPVGECSRSCGKGVQLFTRTVEQLPSEGGAGCPRLVEQRICEETSCESPEQDDVNCEVSSWFGWDDCSRSCGGGWRERYREVLVERRGDGRRCPDLEDRVRCNRFECDSDEDDCSGSGSNSKSKSKSKSKRRCRGGKSKSKGRRRGNRRRNNSH